MYKIYFVDYKQIEEDLVELSLFERIAKLGEEFTLKLKNHRQSYKPDRI